MIAGPCSVESEEQIVIVAKAVKAAGAQLLRGGAFKPRTSPYAFQGLQGERHRALLEIAKQETGLPIVTETHEHQRICRCSRMLTSFRSARATCRISIC